jgi:hypothetical protein
MLATRGAVYKTQRTAGDGNKYHRHCRCRAELETDFDAREDIRISPEDANRQIGFRGASRDYAYDMSDYRIKGVTDPPRVPTPAPVREVAPLGADKVAAMRNELRNLREMSDQSEGWRTAFAQKIKELEDSIARNEWQGRVPRIKPESPVSAASRSNPNYDLPDDQWHHNCTRCVSAMEMRMRGWKVTAAPLPKGTSTQSTFDTLFNNDDVRQLSDVPGGKMVSVGAGAPDGARFWVRGDWKRTNGGHVFMAERRGGKTYFYDPQSGKDLGTEGYGDRMTNLRAIRVDDAELSDNALALVLV